LETEISYLKKKTELLEGARNGVNKGHMRTKFFSQKSTSIRHLKTKMHKTQNITPAFEDEQAAFGSVQDQPKQSQKLQEKGTDIFCSPKQGTSGALLRGNPRKNTQRKINTINTRVAVDCEEQLLTIVEVAHIKNKKPKSSESLNIGQVHCNKNFPKLSKSKQSLRKSSIENLKSFHGEETTQVKVFPSLSQK